MSTLQSLKQIRSGRYTITADLQLDWEHITDIQLTWIRTPSTALKVSGQFIAGPLAFELAAFYRGSRLGLAFSGSFKPALNQTLSISNALAHLGEKLDIGDLSILLPDAIIGDLRLNQLDFSFNTKTKAFALRCIGLLGEPDELSPPQVGVIINVNPDRDQGYDQYIKGQLLVHNSVFDLIFDRYSKRTTLLASYVNEGSDSNIAELIDELSGTSVAEDFGLNFEIKNALLVYEKTKESVANKSDKKYLFAADMDTGLDLSGLGKLPLVGAAFSGGSRLALSFSPAYATQVFERAEVTALQQLLPQSGLRLPALDQQGQIKKGFHFVADLEVDGERKQISIPGANNNNKQLIPGKDNGQLGSPTLPNEAIALAPPTPPSAVNWVDIQKRFGPLHVNRIGVGMKKTQLSMLLDAEISVSGLTLGLYGLGVAYDIKEHELAFSLRGMGLDVQRGPLAIGANFLNYDGDFIGRAVIRTEQFNLSALGAFSDKLGQPSMFLYGFLDYPLGGPAFFFVEGLAAGFGFNRSIKMPSVRDINSFPLVVDAIAGANGQNPASGLQQGGTAQQVSMEAQLERLHQYISPSLGEYFLAVGVKFNSFKIIDAFALLTLAYSASQQRLLINLLGVGTIEVPPDSAQNLAHIEINLKAFMDPMEGILLVQSQLNRNSWILSQDCYLRGGLAFGLWFKGDHAGDFVYTFGGYHPDFNKPGHYPTVPRLGFNWHVSSAVSVKGDMYYALTPKVLMAGGHLNATWHSGSLRAWFTFGADFLIQFKPFHYDAKASIEIGASYQSALGFTVSGSLGADLHVWGPDFSGQAHFHFGPFSFKVDFGDSGSEKQKPISWQEFKQSFLPKHKSVIALSSTAGLKKTVIVENNEHWVVDPKTFQLQISTAIPITSVFHVPVTGTAVDMPSILHHNFGVAPMNKFSAIDSQVLVKIENDDVDVTEEFEFITQVKKFPSGMWGRGFQQLNGTQTVAATGGLGVVPIKPTALGGTSVIKRRALDYELQHPATQPQASDYMCEGYHQKAWREFDDLERDREFLARNMDDDRVRDSIQRLPESLLKALDLDPLEDIRLADIDGLAAAYVVPPQIVNRA